MKAFLVRNRARYARAAGAAVAIALLVASCDGHGGGWLPPGPGVEPPNNAFTFQGRANIGFSFTCENDRLHLSLEYQERGTYTLPDNPLGRGNPFSIHAESDRISPALQSYFCLGDAQNGGLPPGEIVFQGVYRVQSGSPGNYATRADCSQTFTLPDGSVLTGCRLIANVRDHGTRGPSASDYFSIKLFGGPDVGDVTRTVIPLYSRDGYLEGGNFQVNNP